MLKYKNLSTFQPWKIGSKSRVIEPATWNWWRGLISTWIYWIKPRLLLSILYSLVPPKNFQSHIETILKWRKFVLKRYERQEKKKGKREKENRGERRGEGRREKIGTKSYRTKFKCDEESIHNKIICNWINNKHFHRKLCTMMNIVKWTLRRLKHSDGEFEASLSYKEINNFKKVIP